MLTHLKYYAKIGKHRFFKAIFQLLCNFIPLTKWRVRARNALFDAIKMDKIILLNQVDSHLPKKVLAQINSIDNEYFIAQNAKIATGGGGGL